MESGGAFRLLKFLVLCLGGSLGSIMLLQELVEWDSPQWEDKREKGRKGPAQIRPLDYSGSRVMKL